MPVRRRFEFRFRCRPRAHDDTRTNKYYVHNIWILDIGFWARLKLYSSTTAVWNFSLEDK